MTRRFRRARVRVVTDAASTSTPRPRRCGRWSMDPDAHATDWVTIHRALKSHSDGEPRGRLRDGADAVPARREVQRALAGRRGRRARVTPSGRAAGPARSHASTEYRLTPHDGGTRFDYRNEFKAPLGPLGAMASRALVGGVPEKEANASLAKLKKLLEALAERRALVVAQLDLEDLLDAGAADAGRDARGPLAPPRARRGSTRSR